MSRLIGKWIRNGYKSFERWRSYSNSRKQARAKRKEIVNRKGDSCVTAKMEQEMKKEMKNRFGDEGHWVWIALYTELRGEYLKGWVPDDFYSFRILPYLNPNPWAKVSTCKSYDHRLFPGFATVPRIIRINGLWFDAEMNTVEIEKKVAELRSEQCELVIKRDGSPSGFEIDFINGADLSLEYFKENDNYLIQPSLKQHQSLSRIHSHSLNTVRITTFFTSSGNVEVKFRTLRVGVGGTRIANVIRGGLLLFLNQEGGTVTNALDELGIEVGDTHPDTHFPYSDIRVPSVPKADELCKSNHLKIPYVRLIAWDLYINQNGEPRMIEWNAVRPDLWVNEAHLGPLWSEEEIREVMERGSERE